MMYCPYWYAVNVYEPQYIPKSQIGEKGKGQEDCRDSTSDVSDEGEDGSLDATG